MLGEDDRQAAFKRKKKNLVTKGAKKVRREEEVLSHPLEIFFLPSKLDLPDDDVNLVGVN